jgi:hypothetical protein
VAEYKDKKLRHAGYKSLATNILSLHSVGALPVSTDIVVFSEEGKLEGTLISRSGKCTSRAIFDLTIQKLNDHRSAPGYLAGICHLDPELLTQV